METQVLYNINHQEAFGLFIAIYFYLTGLSAGSFILSTLSYGFGMVQFKSLGRVGIVLATALLIVAPLFLLLHIGAPYRAWHLFAYLNLHSPITWGCFLLILYPLNCMVYGYFNFALYLLRNNFIIYTLISHWLVIGCRVNGISNK